MEQRIQNGTTCHSSAELTSGRVQNHLKRRSTFFFEVHGWSDSSSTIEDIGMHGLSTQGDLNLHCLSRNIKHGYK
jgi:hypothetical protein